MLKRVSLLSISLMVITPLQFYAMQEVLVQKSPRNSPKNMRKAQLVALHNLNVTLPVKQNSSKIVTPLKLATVEDAKKKEQADKLLAERAQQHGNAIERALWQFDIKNAIELYKDGASAAVGDPLAAFLHEWRARLGWNAYAKGNYHSIVTWLVKDGAKVNANNNRAESPLQFVLKQCQEGCCAKTLCDAGARIGPDELRLAVLSPRRVHYFTMMLNGKREISVEEFIDQHGDTPYFWVLDLPSLSGSERLTLLELLHKSGAPINQPAHGVYPLHKAISLGEEDSVLFFLQQGASIECVNDAGQTPVSIAVEKGNISLLQMLLARGAKITPAVLVKAAEVHNVDALREFFERVTAARMRDQNAFPDISITYTLPDGKTLLHVAAVDQRKERFRSVDVAKKHEIICYLLTEGCPLDAQDRLGDTALVSAIKAGDIEGMQLLLNHGADFTKSDFLNKSPLDHAQEQWGKQHAEHRYNKLKYELEKYIKLELRAQFDKGRPLEKKQGKVEEANLTFENDMRAVEISMLSKTHDRLVREDVSGMSEDSLALRTAELAAIERSLQTLLGESKVSQMAKNKEEINK